MTNNSNPANTDTATGADTPASKKLPNFVRITGSPTAGGIALLDDTGRIWHWESVSQSTRWNMTSKVVESPAKDMLMCGANTNGIAVKGAKFEYVTSVGNSEGKWKSVPDIGNANIIAITGDNDTGFTVLDKSGTGQTIRQLPALDGKSKWTELPTPPFDVTMLAGDNKNGLLIVGGDGADVAHTNADCTCWTQLRAPFGVEMLTGNGVGGFVLYGEGRLASIDSKWNLAQLPRPILPVKHISGNAKDGLVAVLGQGDVVAYCTDLSKAQWIISTIVQPE